MTFRVCDGECVCVSLLVYLRSKHVDKAQVWVYFRLSVSFEACVCVCVFDASHLICLCNFTFVECILKHSHQTLLSQLRFAS